MLEKSILIRLKLLFFLICLRGHVASVYIETPTVVSREDVEHHSIMARQVSIVQEGVHTRGQPSIIEIQFKSYNYLANLHIYPR